jgi:hypothetical protein
MKNIIGLIFCILNAVLLQAQNASRFPINPSAKWYITNITFAPQDDNEKILEKHEFFINSDTLINSLNYYKLYKSGVAYYDTPFYFESIYVGAIRDVDNKFYFIEKNETTEVLLFDYNLKMGDTIHSKTGKNYVVNLIDTLPDGRRRFWSLPNACGGCCTTISLIEGIGHSGGIIEDPPCEHIGFYGYYLNCFLIDGELIYQNDMSLVNCENFYSSLDNLKENGKIVIYPVPASKILTIEFSDLSETSAEIDIFDIAGSTVLSKIIHPNLNKIELNIQSLKKGVYVIRISENNLFVTKKILVE